MSKKTLLGVLAVGLLAGPMAAQAIPMRLDATSLDTSISSNFSLEFDDTGDGLVQVGEITSFSGVTITSIGTNFWELIVGTPDLAGISTGSCNGYCLGAAFWTFISPAKPDMYQGAIGSLYSYSLTDLSAVGVPEPGTLALFGLGLAGLGLIRRRRSV